MFAFEHEEVVPDILIMAKALGSGLPISGVAANWDVMAHWIPGTHGSTYAANPVACAAAAETIRVICEEGLVENAAKMGALLQSGLKAIAARDAGVGEARGIGLMSALEFSTGDGHPDPERVERILTVTRGDGLLLASCGPHKNVIRYMPALTIGAADIELALDVTERALTQTSNGSAVTVGPRSGE